MEEKEKDNNMVNPIFERYERARAEKIYFNSVKPRLERLAQTESYSEDESSGIKDYGDRYFKREASTFRNYWARISKIALMRFPGCERGEKIHAREVRARLSQLRQAGYPVTGYSGMNSQEVWNYLMRTRAQIAEQARTYYLEVLEQIQAENQYKKEQDESHL